MAQETQLLKLDLDTKEFIAKLDAAEAKLGEMGDPTTVSGLLDTFKSMSGMLGVLAAGAVAAKAALDLTFEAESVKAINQQFEILTRNAGVSGAALKQSLLEIADGLVDDEDLLKSAGQAVVQLGSNAERLPEIFQLARQVTNAFGGDLISNFEKINQAIANGNARALKQYGLTVDQDKVLRDYAKTIGVTVDSLSDQERKTAILNATIQKGQTALKGVSGDVLQATNTWKQLQVTLAQIGETAAVAFEKIAGKQVTQALKNVTESLKLFSAGLTEKFSEGAEQAEAKNERLRLSLKAVEKDIAGAENNVRIYSESMARGTNLVRAEFEAATSSLARLNEEKSKILAELGQAQAQAQEAGAGPGASPEAAVTRDQEAADRRLAVASKFEEDLATLKLSRISKEMEVAMSVEEVERLQQERKQTMLTELLAREDEVRARIAEGKMTQAQGDLQLAEIRKSAVADIRSVEIRAEEERLRALQTLAQATQMTTAGFANGFKAASASASSDLRNFSKLGQAAFGGLQGSLMAGYNALASGSKDAGEAMKEFFIGAIADKAAAAGATMVLESIWPPNPLAAAGGLALMALAGNLKRLAGGGASGGISAPSPSIGAAAPSMDMGSPGMFSSGLDRPQMDEARRRREVQLVIQGSYFETEATNRRLMEMIRSETDATGFSYVQIGQGV